MPYAIKAALADPSADSFTFTAQKTMYGGKHIAAGDTLFLFASENEGGSGLIARGVVVAAWPVARQPGLVRQTPRVGVRVKRTSTARRALGRRELKPLNDWQDGRPGTELNFKLYRQATDKIVGLSDAAVAFLDTFF